MACSMRRQIGAVFLYSGLLVGFFGSFGNTQWLVDDDGCRTPDKGIGNCIPVKNCAPMVTLLTSLKRPIPQTTLQKIQAYTCGADNSGAIKVCCPPGPINIEGATSSGPPDVSNHRNLNLLPEDCGYFDAPNKIINGDDASLGEFPWMALLSYNTKSGPQFKCGGTIINKNYILTAAHCITSLTNPLYNVRVGEYSLRNETDCEKGYKGKITCAPAVQDVKIEQVIPHKDYATGAYVNDIGLLRVSEMNLNQETTRPVCLPLGKHKTAQYKVVTVTGWGTTENGTSSDILQKVNLDVADKIDCVSLYSKHSIKVTDKQTCAGGKNRKDSCSGDSGGPMHVPQYFDGETRYVQQGIVSFGPRFCGLEGYPGVYTLVPYYMDWILDNMRP